MPQQPRTISAAEIAAQLAPSGRLRAAINIGNAVLAQRDKETDEVTGVSPSLAAELGGRLGLPVDLKIYDAAGKVFDDADRNVWDIAFLGQVPERAGALLFTESYVYVEASAAVPVASRFRSVADLDSPGVTIIGVKGSAYDPHLSRTIKVATLIRETSPAKACEKLAAGGGDAAAGVRQVLEEFVKSNPNFRVLTDAFVHVEQAMALPHSRAAALNYIDAFLREMKASGFVRRVLDATGQTGALVAESSIGPTD